MIASQSGNSSLFKLSLFRNVAYYSNIKQNPGEHRRITQHKSQSTRSYFAKQYFTTPQWPRHYNNASTAGVHEGGEKKLKIRHIRLMEAYQLQQQNREDENMEVIFIDCRRPEVTQMKGTIQNNEMLGDFFLTIPLKGGDEDEFDDAIDSLSNKINRAVDCNKNVTIISFCNKGNWSLELCRYLIDGGLEKDILLSGRVVIESLRGGFDSWAEAGFPTKDVPPVG